MTHEWVYLRPCDNGVAQQKSLTECFDWYNRKRPHQSLNRQTPDEAYLGALGESATYGGRGNSDSRIS